jgi:hypothetical protein
MGVRALVAALLVLVTLCNADAHVSRLESRDLSIADIPVCGVSHGLPFTSQPLTVNRYNACSSQSQQANAVSMTSTAHATTSVSSAPWGRACSQTVRSPIGKRPRGSRRGFVASRLAGKIASKRLGWDDGIVVAALLLAAVPMGFVLAMTKFGFGEHLWDLGEGRLVVVLKYCELCQLPLSARS